MFKFNFCVENEEQGTNKDESTKDSLDGQEERSEKRARLEEEFGMWTFEQLAELKLNEKTNHPPASFRKLYLNRPPKLGEHNYDLVEERDSSSDEQYAYVEFVTELGLDENDALARINKTHDLVSGKYEGGLKVWELSIDLARLIYNLNTVEHFDAQTQSSTIIDDLKWIRAFFHHTISDESVTEFRLLELGCGHALPSLAVLKLIDTLLHRSSPLKIILYLQDFNKNVIKNITYENINNYLRTRSTHNSAKIDVKFVYGDWQEIYENDRESLSSSSSVTSQIQLLPENYFHLILTSETIYNRNNYKHLLNLFKVCLLNENRFDSTNYETKTSAIQNEQKSIELTTTTTTNLSDKTTNEPEINTRTNTTSSSFVLLSAKTYYFGCGGNLHEFLNVAKSTGYLFKSTGNLLVDLLITNTPPRSDSNINNFNNSSNHSTTDNDATNSTFDNHKLEQQQQQQPESTNDVNSNSNNAFVSFSTISKEIIKIYPS